jgi:hypothetical protein
MYDKAQIVTKPSNVAEVVLYDPHNKLQLFP